METTINENEWFSDNSLESEEYDIDLKNQKTSDEMMAEIQSLIFISERDKPNIVTENNILESFKKQYDAFYSFIPKTSPLPPISDPYQHVLKLKSELEETSKEIKDYVSLYNDHLLLKQTENFEEVLKELDTYKEKLHRIIASDLYKKEITQQKDKSTLKKEIKENLKAYSKISNNLLEQISKQKKEILTGNIKGINLAYELLSPIKSEDNVNHAKELKELEEKIENIEKLIGKWDKFKLQSNVFDTVFKLVNWCDEKLEKDLEHREKLMNRLSILLDNFIRQTNEGKEKIELFLKIRDIYSILEISEEFDEIFVYFKKRLKVIKAIHEDSDKFNTKIEKLQSKIKENEGNLNELGKKFNQTIEEFERMEDILKELKNVEKEINKLLI